jgi:DNA-binding NtrC family response regulator
MLNKRILLRHEQNIVVLDDDEDSLTFFKNVLKQFRGCNIEYYNYPTKEFCNHVVNKEIDLFIMDIRLGKFENGIKITEDIICGKRGTIFLFVSGYDYSPKDFEHLDGLCVYDFLAKPIDIEQFVMVTSTLLNIAATYKHALKMNKSVECACCGVSDMDKLRRRYFKQIKEDRILIDRLNKTVINQAKHCTI